MGKEQFAEELKKLTPELRELVEDLFEWNEAKASPEYPMCDFSCCY